MVGRKLPTRIHRMHDVVCFSLPRSHYPIDIRFSSSPFTVAGNLVVTYTFEVDGQDLYRSHWSQILDTY
jgi:hypothetical protein